MNEWLTIAEAAQALCVSRQRVHVLIQQGQLRSITTARPRRLLVKGEDVTARLTTVQPPPDHVLVETVADGFGVAPSTVRRWCRRGDLRGVQIDGRWWIHTSDANTFAPPKVGRPRKLVRS